MILVVVVLGEVFITISSNYSVAHCHADESGLNPLHAFLLFINASGAAACFSRDIFFKIINTKIKSLEMIPPSLSFMVSPSDLRDPGAQSHACFTSEN